MTKKVGRLLKGIDDADDAYDEGNMRLAADHCLRCFLKFPHQMNYENHHYNCFTLYTLIIQSEQVEDTLEDQKQLKKIGEDKRVPVLFRSEAWKTLGILKAQKGERHVSAECCRRAIHLIDNVKDKEKKRILTKEAASKPTIQRIKDVLSKCRQDVQDLLRVMESGVLVACDATKHAPTKETLHNRFDHDFVQSSSLLPQKALPDLIPRLTAGGNRCDYCGATPQALGLTTLDVCSQCWMMHYCSKECQTKAWK